MIDERNKMITNEIQQASDEIDLLELFNAIWQGKWLILAFTGIFSVASVGYAINLPDIYKSEALLAPVSDKGGIKVPGQLGGLAALAGVDLGGMGGGDKTDLALEIIKSRDFLGRFIEKYDLYIPLMASKGWNRADNSLVIDSKIYDAASEKWVRKAQPPFQPKPSVLETHEAFLKLITVAKDKVTGMVNLSIEHYSPYLAKNLVEQLVKAINDEMRQRDLSEAQKSITYLNVQVEQTNIADLRTMFYSLIEDQTKTLMLANVREEYVFKTVDPAVVAEKKAKPARALVCVLGAMLGFILSTLVVLIRYFNRR